MTDSSVHWPSAIVGDLADEYGVTAFEMRDFGSKAKNTQGPDSDIDAMVLFSQPAEDHKLLGQYKDSVCREMYGVDVQGWSLKKFGSLLADSNPTAIEFLNSGVVYYRARPKREFADLLDELTRYTNRNLNPIGLYYHYRNMAKDNYKQYIVNGNRPTVKKNLTVARAILYARHVRRTGSFPGMDFETFLDHHVEQDLAERVRHFLTLKRDGEAKAKVSNPFEDFVEYELGREVEDDDLNRQGIDLPRVNQFMRDVDTHLF